MIQQWLEVSEPYRSGTLSQHVTPIDGPLGWLKYLSKHAARGVRHYQRFGKPAGWSTTGRLWGHGGQWPVVEPFRLELTHEQAYRFRRLVRRYAIAQARSAALEYESRAQPAKAAASWDSVAYLRRMLKTAERGGPPRGVSQWGSQEVVLRLAEAAGWDGALA